MLLFIQKAFSMILSNQLRTTTNCAVLWFSDDTAGAKYSWIPSGGGEYGVQQTKHPELCLESKSQTPRPEGSVCICTNMCVVFLIFFILYFVGYILLYLSPNVNRGDCISFLLIAFDMKLATLHLRFCVWCSQSVSPPGQKGQCYCI